MMGTVPIAKSHWRAWLRCQKVETYIELELNPAQSWFFALPITYVSPVSSTELTENKNRAARAEIILRFEMVSRLSLCFCE